MRNILPELTKHCADTVALAAARLLQIDANVPSHGGVALAGGFVRDLYFGHKPKDMDFAFWNLTVDEFHHTFSMWMARAGGGVEVQVLPERSDYDGAERILQVIQLTLADGTPVDWILYNAVDLQQVYAEHDHSINNFGMYYDGDFALHVEGPANWGVCTRNPERALSQERVERFREMARANDWEYRA